MHKINYKILEGELRESISLDVNDIETGDMPGDKVEINQGHINKANVIFPELLKTIEPILEGSFNKRVVISVHGGSGVGKSEISSLLSHYFKKMNIGSYVMSGDNYPRRIPRHNDAERKRIFTNEGLKGLVSVGGFTRERFKILSELQKSDNDANPTLIEKYPWIKTYQMIGRKQLTNYLGSIKEIDFGDINRIIYDFKTGHRKIMLKRMGREVEELWYEEIDFSNINILMIEWTHGNSRNLQGVDVPVLLNSTPQETLEHRRTRNRDGAIDSPFTTMVLDIEQELLHSQAANAKIIVTKSEELVSYHEYMDIMDQL